MIKESKLYDVPLRDLIDYVFPYEKISEWFKEVEVKRVKPPDDMMLVKVRAITKDPNFWAKNPALQREELMITQSLSGETVKMVENGYFYPKRLVYLDDPEITRILEEYGEEIRECVPIGQMNTAMRFATVMTGIITEHHGLSPEAVMEVAKLHCVQRTAYDYPKLAGTPQENAFMLYGCMKIIAQRLDMGIIGKASWVDEYKS